MRVRGEEATQDEVSFSGKPRKSKDRGGGGGETRRALLATIPYRELSLEESRSTLLKYLLGEEAIQELVRHKIKVQVTVHILQIIGSSSPYLLLLPLSQTAQLCQLFIGASSGLIFTVLYTSQCNLILLRMLLKCFDSIFFLAEAILFAGSLWGVFCFSVSGFLLTIIVLCFTIAIIAYDAFPMFAKKGMKISFLYGLGAFCFLIAGIALDLFAGVCHYHVDVLTWKGLEPEALSATNISLHSLCVNAGCTYFILAARTAYSLLFRPQECVILTSSMRMIESRTGEEQSTLKAEVEKREQTLRQIEERRACFLLSRALKTKALLSLKTRVRTLSSRILNYKGPAEGVKAPCLHPTDGGQGNVVTNSSQLVSVTGRKSASKVCPGTGITTRPPSPNERQPEALRQTQNTSILSLAMPEPSVGERCIRLSQTSNIERTDNDNQDSSDRNGICRGRSQLSVISSPALLSRPSASLKKQTSTEEETLSTELAWNTVIVAVTPAILLSEKNSAASLMSKYLGKRFTSLWFRHKLFTNAFGSISLIYYIVYVHLSLLRTHLGEHLTLALFNLAATIHLTLMHMPLANYKILTLVLRSFSTLFICGEAFLFTVSLWIYQCTTLFALYIALTFAVGFVLSILYDAISVSSRKRMRYSYVLALGMTLAVSTAAQFGGLERYCHVRFTVFPFRLEMAEARAFPSNPLLSLRPRDPSSVGAQRAVGFTVQEFLISRGFTVAILMGRIFYGAIKHPNECKLLSSSVRIINVAYRPTAGPTDSPSSPRLRHSSTISSTSESNIVSPSDPQPSFPPVLPGLRK